MSSWLQSESALALAGLVVAVLALVAGIVIPVALHRRRHKDSDIGLQRKIRSFVRECESRRVLWNRFADEEPALSHGAVRDLRREVAKLLGILPENAQGVDELMAMQQALAKFCEQYETLQQRRVSRRKLRTGSSTLTQLIADLRSCAIPAIDRLCQFYGITPGQRDRDTNPFIGRQLGTLYVKPPRE